MKEILKKFGLTEDGMGFSDRNGCYYETIERALWGGVLGFCCCGEPDKGLKIIRDVLDAIESREFKEEFVFHYYILDKLGLTNHGSSIYYSWLSDAGEALLKILRELELQS